jgi:hypothetical protein
MRTLHTGPDELLVGVKTGVKPEYQAGELASVINSAERRIRAARPAARWIYIEPDIATRPREVASSPRREP